MSISIPLKLKSGKTIQAKLDIPPSSTSAQLSQLLQTRYKCSCIRLTRTDTGAVLTPSETLPDLSLIAAKDLGAQISWRTVFVIEYLGPLVIHPVVYAWYGQPKSLVQKLALGMVLAHFVKRELETVFVHRFSNDSMPLSNLFKNSAHYWFLSGVLLAGSIYSSKFSPFALRGTWRDDPTILMGMMALFVAAESVNLYTHLYLKSLRPAGTRTRALPTASLFKLVTCPNYLFESLSWLAFVAMTGSWAAALFWTVSTVQMALWAKRKQIKNGKDFGRENGARWAMVPFVY